jgi:transposase
LPEYSPDYNLIELVWHSAKEHIANRLFTSIEELELLLHRLLNEGELTINWNRKLKNKGNSVNTVSMRLSLSFSATSDQVFIGFRILEHLEE